MCIRDSCITQMLVDPSKKTERNYHLVRGNPANYLTNLIRDFWSLSLVPSSWLGQYWTPPWAVTSQKHFAPTTRQQRGSLVTRLLIPDTENKKSIWRSGWDWNQRFQIGRLALFFALCLMRFSSHLCILSCDFFSLMNCIAYMEL